MSKATIKTSKGTMIFDLYNEEAPKTVQNFEKLSNDGFYNNLNFHRVIPEFVLQGGCPQGTGVGGPGYSIPCETDGEKQFHDRGVLSMAHAGKDTGGSQFFVVMNRANTAHLDGVHTCFGKLTEGDEVIDLIEQGDKIESITIS
jgi:peptidyl-prolyl cis-trans isomerase B (cyclophilin B)